jgi:hypothetical protein
LSIVPSLCYTGILCQRYNQIARNFELLSLSFSYVSESTSRRVGYACRLPFSLRIKSCLSFYFYGRGKITGLCLNLAKTGLGTKDLFRFLPIFISYLFTKSLYTTSSTTLFNFFFKGLLPLSQHTPFLNDPFQPKFDPITICQLNTLSNLLCTKINWLTGTKNFQGIQSHLHITATPCVLSRPSLLDINKTNYCKKQEK